MPTAGRLASAAFHLPDSLDFLINVVHMRLRFENPQKSIVDPLSLGRIRVDFSGSCAKPKSRVRHGSPVFPSGDIQDVLLSTPGMDESEIVNHPTATLRLLFNGLRGFQKLLEAVKAVEGDAVRSRTDVLLRLSCLEPSGD